MQHSLTILLPARNEAQSLKTLIPCLKTCCSEAKIIIVNDGSTDETMQLCEQEQIRVLNHALPLGNGAAIKTGLAAVQTDWVLVMDADGQHRPEDVQRIINAAEETQADMVVGSRNKSGQASFIRFIGNTIYNGLASWIVSSSVPDLTSGFRLMDASKAKTFIHLLPNRFSSPSTLTLAFFKSNYKVVYVPVEVQQRIGRSHLRPVRDGARFFILLYKLTLLYAPMKIFGPLSAGSLIIGAGHLGYVYSLTKKIDIFDGVLIGVSLVLLLLGLMLEHIRKKMYKRG